MLTYSLSTAHAQETFQLIVVPYTSDKNLTSIYQEVEKVFDIIKPPEAPEPIVLAAATSEQVVNLKKQGFQVDVLDDKAELEKYVYLFATDVNLIPQLTSLGEVQTVTNNRILVKLAQDKDFSPTGIYSEFFKLPFNTNQFPEPVYSASPVSERTVMWVQRLKQTILYPILLIGIVILSLSIFFNLKNKGSQQPGWKNLIAQVVLFIELVIILVIIAL